MLLLWTKANKAVFTKKVVPFVKAYDVPAKIVPLIEGELPVAADGDVVLGFGAGAVSTLQDHKIIPKGRKLGSVRDKEHLHNGTPFLLTWDPGLLSREYERGPELQWDVHLAIRRHNTGTIKPKVGKYRWVPDFSEALEYINDVHATLGKAVEVAVDLETVGLVPFLPDVYIVSIFITYRKGESDGLHLVSTQGKLSPKQHSQIKELLTSPKIKVRGANFKFDSLWMFEKWGIDCTNFSFDTLVVGSLLDENRSNSLKLHARLFTDLGGYEDELEAKYDKAEMHKVPKEDLLTYAGGDTDATWQTAKKLKKDLLEDKKLANFYIKLLHPSLKTFEIVERRGMLVDVKEYERLRVEVGGELVKLEAKAFSLMNGRVRAKHKDNLSLTRAAIIKDFMFSPLGLDLDPQMVTEKSGEPSTAMDHLNMFRDDPRCAEFIQVLSEYNSAKKTMSTYIDGFLKHLRPDGKFHPTYMLHHGDFHGDDSGTVTGRSSAKDPAFQTIPKHTKWAKPLRRVYVAPPGHVVLNTDYSQGELRVTACVADEPIMIQAYLNGIDLHALTGCETYGVLYEDYLKMPEKQQKVIRQGGKAGNFGLIYGMSAEGFVDYAWYTYGVKLSLEQATAFREKFFIKYKRLVTWHETYKSLAHRNGFVRSPLGRVRHLPMLTSPFRDVVAKNERQAINSPIQSTLSDLTQRSMVELGRRYPDLWMFGMTHDSIHSYVPEDQVELWGARITEVMSNLPLEKEFGWKPQLPFIADAEFGPNLAELTKL